MFVLFVGMFVCLVSLLFGWLFIWLVGIPEIRTETRLAFLHINTLVAQIVSLFSGGFVFVIDHFVFSMFIYCLCGLGFC